MRLSLVKCHGSGNDFPLLDAREVSLADEAWAAVARSLAERAGPVGGDGMLLLTGGGEGAAFGMRMFNSDGSESEQCLNGLRCVARAGFEALGLDRATVRLKTSTAEVARAPDLATGVYTVREVAGPAGLDVTAWPMHIGRAQNVDRPVEPLPSIRALTAVAMPNPHLVAFVETVDEAELVRVGEICETAPAWLPNRANVSFVERRDDGLYVRTFERGVGLTDSCGSAMAASIFAACLTGRARWDEAITVWNKGGLVRAAAAESAMVTLEGNATWEWQGTVKIDPDSGAVSDVRVKCEYQEERAAWRAVLNPPPFTGEVARGAAA